MNEETETAFDRKNYNLNDLIGDKTFEKEIASAFTWQNCNHSSQLRLTYDVVVKKAYVYSDGEECGYDPGEIELLNDLNSYIDNIAEYFTEPEPDRDDYKNEDDYYEALYEWEGKFDDFAGKAGVDLIKMYIETGEIKIQEPEEYEYGCEND